MGAMTKKLTGAQKFAPQVQAETLLRFGPQEQALSNRIADARAQRSQSRGTAGSVARTVGAAVDNADVQVQKAYAPATDTANHAASLITTSQEIQALPQGSALKAALAEGTAGSQTRLAEGLAAARTDLANRKTQAVSGAEYAKKQADQVYSGELTKAHRDVAALASQEGAFAQGRLGQLLGDQTKLNHDTGKQKRSQNFTRTENALSRQAKKDAAARKDAAKHAGAPPGSDVLRSAGDHVKAKDTLSAVTSAIQSLRDDEGLSSKEIQQILVGGRQAQTLTDSKGNKAKLKGYTKVPKTWVEAAIQSDVHGYIHPSVVKRLHALGYSLTQLGLSSGVPSSLPAV